MVISITGLCVVNTNNASGLQKEARAYFCAGILFLPPAFQSIDALLKRWGIVIFYSGGLPHADLQEGGVAQLVRAQAS